jgi:polyhydroxyalkanoate synthase subunit PhaE
MSSQNPFTAAWQQPMLDMQRNYWEAWSEMSRHAMGLSQPPKPAWESALDNWWQSASALLPNESRPLFNQFLDRGKEMLKMQQEWQEQFQRGDWQSAANATLDRWSKLFNPGAADQWAKQAAEPWQQWTKQIPAWLQPETLSRMAESGWSATGIPPSLQGMMNAPGVGYFREHEANYKGLLNSVNALQQALQAYSQYFADLNQVASERLRQALLAKDAKPVTGARDLYDRWIAMSEEIYAERVNSAEYQAIHGRLVNSQMACRRDLQRLIQPLLQLFGLPTQAELRTLQQRLQEMRRNERQQQQVIESLAARITALEAQASAATNNGGGSVAESTVQSESTAVAKPSPKSASAAPRSSKPRSRPASR